MNVMPLVQLGMPLALGIGGLLAWRATRDQQRNVEDPRNTWVDHSLDDWRAERDRAAEEERTSRERGS